MSTMNNCMYEQIISVLEGRVTNYFHNICNLLESHHVNENVDHNNKRFSARADLSPIKVVLNVINDQFNYCKAEWLNETLKWLAFQFIIITKRLGSLWCCVLCCCWWWVVFICRMDVSRFHHRLELSSWSLCVFDMRMYKSYEVSFCSAFLRRVVHYWLVTTRKIECNNTQ